MRVGMISAAGNSGHAEGTTQAAIADGTITIRDKASQKQDVADLSRDTEHANDSISPIFDKEKEQNRLKAVGMISEIGSQVADIARTQGDLNGLKKAQSNSKTTLPANATEKERQDYLAGLRNSQAYKEEMEKFGTGSDIQRGIQAATAALQGLAGGNIGGALAGASAPELANIIGHHAGIDDNTAAKAIAHAILGGVTAALQGNSAAAGAVGAGSGELVAVAIARSLYPNTDPSKLTEDQKQTVSTLATLSAGMAGGIAGGNVSGAAAGASAGKNVAENNALSDDEEEIKSLHGNRPLKIFDINPMMKPGLVDEDGNTVNIGASKAGKPGTAATKLPSGYAANASGNVVGPKGGVYNNTGKVDSAGNVIYSNNGGYYIFTEGAKSGTSSPNPSNQVRQNYEQGKVFEDKVYQEHSVDKSVSAREITVKTPGGTNVRIDIISKDKQGNITCIECKSSSTAPLTPNQKVGYPEIEKNGATVTGAGKPGFEGGTMIPPTKIDIIRPDKTPKR